MKAMKFFKSNLLIFWICKIFALIRTNCSCAYTCFEWEVLLWGVDVFEDQLVIILKVQCVNHEKSLLGPPPCLWNFNLREGSLPAMGNTAPAPAAGSRPGSAEEWGGCGPVWPLQLHEYSRPRHRHYHRRSSTMNIRAAGICSPESNRERLIFPKKWI